MAVKDRKGSGVAQKNMRLKKILRLEFNSQILRFVLRMFYREGDYYRVLWGPLRGFKLYYRRDVNFHVMLGLWERDSFEVLMKLINHFGLNKKGMVIADVGANIGYYSLFFSRYMQPDTKIVAFEPSVSIQDVIKKNLSINQIPNVKLVNMACTDKSGEIIFYLGKHHHESSILGSWAENDVKGVRTIVKSTSLDEYFYKGDPKLLPDLIKMDIEGGGVYALKGSDKCIAEKRPFILIESHTPDEDMAISNVLLQHNYHAFRINTKQWVKKRSINYVDRDGVWGTMLLVPAELKDKFAI